jgi:uroporphyrinogen decarboxylase
MLAAIAHQETDRVPVGDMGFLNWEQVKQALGIKDNEEALERLGLDLRRIGMWPFPQPEQEEPAEQKAEQPPTCWGLKPGKGFRGEGLDYWGVPIGSGTYRALEERPLAKAETVADLDAYQWPDPDWFDFAAAGQVCRVHAGRVATSGPGWHPIFCGLCHLMGEARVLEHLALNPKLIEAAAEKMGDFYLEFHRRLLEATAGLLVIFDIGDDVAHARGLVMRPELWRRIFKPVLRRLVGMARARGFISWFHCCGAMREIIPDLIEVGVQVLEPCQVHLPGMEPEGLKRDFGRDLTFFGAINTQRTLPRGTPQEVKAEVRERIRVLGRGGGYILSSDHTVLADVPAENVLAMFEAAGSYVPASPQ